MHNPVDLFQRVVEYDKGKNSASRFMALIDKYEKFEELTPAMINEFVNKVLVHERDRKGSIQTTQEIEIYFNFLGRYVPPAMEVELTPEEQAEIERINRIKDKRHQEYLRRKESGWQSFLMSSIKDTVHTSIYWTGHCIWMREHHMFTRGMCLIIWGVVSSAGKGIGRAWF